MLFNKRKALSPLIATILLVAVALSLAGILYSWSSQNFRDTTTRVSESQTDMINCSHVSIYLEAGCVYDSDPEEGGFSNLILSDRSRIKIDQNIIVTVIDAETNIVSTSIEPNFIGSTMNLGGILNENEDFLGLEKPIQRIRVHVLDCPDQEASLSRCN